MGDLADLVEGQHATAGVGGAEVGDGGGALVDGRLHLPRVAVEVVADLDDLCAGGAVGVVVGETVHGLDDDLVLHAVGFGQAVHLCGVAAGDAGGGLEEQSTGGAAADHGGFCADQARDLLAGPAVQFVDVDHDAGCAGHLLQHLGAGAGAAESCNRAGCVDDRGDAEAAVGVFGIGVVLLSQGASLDTNGGGCGAL